MKNHLTEAHRNSCSHCIKSCEAAVNELQKLTAKCISTVKQECAEEIGRSVERLNQCIQACHDCIENCKKHIFQCKDANCNKICDTCIQSCLACIDSCKQTISSCKGGQDTCVPHAQKSIISMNECARACAQCLDM